MVLNAKRKKKKPKYSIYYFHDSIDILHVRFKEQIDNKYDIKFIICE